MKNKRVESWQLNNEGFCKLLYTVKVPLSHKTIHYKENEITLYSLSEFELNSAVNACLEKVSRVLARLKEKDPLISLNVSKLTINIVSSGQPQYLIQETVREFKKRLLQRLQHM